MKRFKRLAVFLLALAAIAVLAGCGPFRIVTVTPEPTGALPGPTTGGDATPTALQPTVIITTLPTEQPTEVPVEVSPTPIAELPTAEPQPTATSVPPGPTATSVPPGPTAAPTSVPPTATRMPLPSATPVTITDWRGEYYDGVSPQGSPKVVRNDRVVDFNLPQGAAPAPAMPSENWSARWSRTWRFDEGNYRFRLVVDDGARLWVADRLLIDAWADGSARELTADLYLRGDTSIKLEYYNRLGDARVRLNWEPVTQYTGWKGSYYDVRDLGGLPVFQRDDARIDFDWGSDSPRANFPSDNFSVRWTRRLNLEAGLYRFEAGSDDGVRVYVDGRLVIDAWRDGQGVHRGEIQLSAGDHDVRVEYYEHTGQAYIKLTRSLVSGPTASPTATGAPPTATPTVPPVPPTATSTATRVPPIVTLPPAVTPTATTTPVPPTITPPAPPPGQAGILLQPNAGPIGQPFNVIGKGWPANATVDLSLVRTAERSSQEFPVGQAVADGAGNFTVQIAVPAGQGWEGMESARVVARSSGVRGISGAVYRILPELIKVRFSPIPVQGDRFNTAEPTYLALDSAEAWAQWFGTAPAQVVPAIDWQKEIVLAAFLGQQRSNEQISVARIVQRDNTVSVWLNTAARGTSGRTQVVNPAAALVRVDRQALELAAKAPLSFVFLDARGSVLAQGPAGSAALLPEGRAGAMALQASGAPGLEAQAKAGVTETQALAAQSGLAEAQAAADMGGGLTETQPVAPALGATAQPEATVVQFIGVATDEASVPGAEAPRETAPGRTFLVWLAVGLSLLVVGGLAVWAVQRSRRA